jgi:hypothetical protein
MFAPFEISNDKRRCRQRPEVDFCGLIREAMSVFIDWIDLFAYFNVYDYGFFGLEYEACS